VGNPDYEVIYCMDVSDFSDGSTALLKNISEYQTSYNNSESWYVQVESRNYNTYVSSAVPYGSVTFVDDIAFESGIPETITFGALGEYSFQYEIDSDSYSDFSAISSSDIKYEIADSSPPGEVNSDTGLVTYGGIGEFTVIGAIDKAGYEGVATYKLEVVGADPPSEALYFYPTANGTNNGYRWFNDDVEFFTTAGISAIATDSAVYIDPVSSDKWASSDILVSEIGTHNNFKLIFKYDDGTITSPTAIAPFGIDKTSPSGINFEFLPEDGDIELETYGYHFEEATLVTISAIDTNINASNEALTPSGIRSITYHLEDEDGYIVGTSTTTDASIGEEINGKIKGEIGGIEIPAEFKGQIYAYATDYAGNESDEAHPHGVIYESPAKHKETSKIEFDAPTADAHQNKPFAYVATIDDIVDAQTDATMEYTSGGSVDLFSTTSAVTFDVTVEDKYSGIKEVSWAVLTPGAVTSGALDWHEEVEIASKGALSPEDTINWDISTESAIGGIRVTTASGIISIDPEEYEYIDMALVIKLTDHMGNVSYDYYAFGIDNTNPDVTGFDFSLTNYQEGSLHSSVALPDITSYGYYFKADTLVTISVKDYPEIAPSGVEYVTYYVDPIASDVPDAGTKYAIGGGSTTTSGAIKILAGFKGKIYATATDYAGNTSEYLYPDGIVQEDANEHQLTSSIKFTDVPTSTWTQSNKVSFGSSNLGIAGGVEKDGDMDYPNDKNVPLYKGGFEFGVEVSDWQSGIREIRWTTVIPDGGPAAWKRIGVSTGGAISGDFTGSSKEWVPDHKDKNLVTSASAIIEVDGNYNDMALVIELTDRAGNKSYDYYAFGIDKTAPEIEVSYDNNDVQNGKYFKADRTATITIKERNFNPALVVSKPTVSSDGKQPVMSPWRTTPGTGNGDDITHTATLTYNADGDYKYSISAKDRADNKNGDITNPDGTMVPWDFTIDKTAPRVSVSYDNNNAINGNYYAQRRNATVIVTEHNFSSSGVNIIGTATDNGSPVAFPSANFGGNGDEHPATIAYAADALYNFDIIVTDLAGNVYDAYTPDEFYVDTTAPEIVISNVEDNSANNDVVMPIITFSDTNYDTNGVRIVLTGANNGQVTPEGSYAADTNGQVFSFTDFERIKASDDLYTLTANIVDMAGNSFEDEINFSVNRFGSVYVFDNSLESIIGSYVSKEVDVKFQEINVDSLEPDTISIKVSKNGATSSLEATSDYTYEKTNSPGEWSVYEYTVPKRHFTSDANYLVQIYSKDLAGNINENIAEEKQAEIGFAIDKTAPVIVVSDLEDGGAYNMDSKTVKASVKDNLKLGEVTVSLNDDSLEYSNEDDAYEFTIPSKNSSQKVSVVAFDAAGNKATFDAGDFLVTTNPIVRWFNNTPLFIGSIAGLLILLGAMAFFIVRRRRSSEEISDMED
jgi:hypothetical protein